MDARLYAVCHSRFFKDKSKLRKAGHVHECEAEKKAEWSAGQAGTLHGLEDEETGSIFAPAPKCCTNGEGSYFAPKITKGDLICLAAIVLNESGMNRWCW